MKARILRLKIVLDETTHQEYGWQRPLEPELLVQAVNCSHLAKQPPQALLPPLAVLDFV